MNSRYSGLTFREITGHTRQIYCIEDKRGARVAYVIHAEKWEFLAYFISDSSKIDPCAKFDTRKELVAYIKMVLA